MMRFCSLSRAALITLEILCLNPFPVLCIVGKEKAVCLLFSLTDAWSFTNHKSPAIENSVVCLLMPTQHEGSHSLLSLNISVWQRGEYFFFNTVVTF